MAEPQTLQFDPADHDSVAVFSGMCGAHQDHRPIPLYLELHHVVPQSWQKLWQP